MYDTLRRKQMQLQEKIIDLTTISVIRAINFVEAGEEIPADIKELILHFAPKPKNETFLSREPDDFESPNMYLTRMSLEAAAELQRAKAREIVLSWGPDKQAAPKLIEGIDPIWDEVKGIKR